MVYNAAGMAKQIEAYRFKENDLFVYSFVSSTSPTYIRSLSNKTATITLFSASAITDIQY